MSEQEPPQKDTESNSRKKIEPTVMVAVITTLGAVIVGIVTSTGRSPSPSPSPQSSSPSASASPDEQKDLTGVWESKNVADTGPATFYVRQDGSTVWWYAQGKGWHHVLKGKLSENQISGEWADIPVGDRSARNVGTIKVAIISYKRMSANDSIRTYQLDRIR
jgi:hypothetical protein